MLFLINYASSYSVSILQLLSKLLSLDLLLYLLFIDLFFLILRLKNRPIWIYFMLQLDRIYQIITYPFYCAMILLYYTSSLINEFFQNQLNLYSSKIIFEVMLEQLEFYFPNIFDRNYFCDHSWNYFKTISKYRKCCFSMQHEQ